MSDAQAACHRDCFAMIEDTDARNTMLLQVNHGGGAGRDPYSAADSGLMSVRIFLQNTEIFYIIFQVSRGQEVIFLKKVGTSFSKPSRQNPAINIIVW